jgi:hypothetical protein
VSWLAAFVFTQAVEVPIYALAQRMIHPSKDGATPPPSRASAWAWRVALAFGASALTHPIVWFVLPPTSRWLGYWGYVALAEAFAVLAEAAYFRALGLPRALLWALGANAASAGLGLASRALWGVP